VGSVLVIAFSWAPFMSHDPLGVTSRTAEPTQTWTVWSDLALLGPLWAAVGLNVLVALLCAVQFFIGAHPWLARAALFASGSSMAVLAAYVSSRKYTLFYTSVTEHESVPRNGWGAYAMFLGSVATFAVLVLAGTPALATRQQGHVLWDLLILVGSVIAIVGSLRPFLISTDWLAAPFLEMEDNTFGAWEWHTFTAPLTWSVIAAVGLAGSLILQQHLTRRRTSNRWPLYLSAYAALVMVGYALSPKYLLFGLNPNGLRGPALPHGPDADLGQAFGMRLGTGGWLMLAGCLATFLGAVLGQLTAAARSPLPEAQRSFTS
jgi:hypothetical protein